ncbi:hypothetical protein TIFTF001_040431 [Ficus carica]|uniref:Uncharacterized protein n=1 Tax=Ficus carica TaxID=3494 RepID=A0AA87YTN2_FICCA|nr:hypothetical protein TIFTF001_040428 [Ficus carica]GMN23281.1 hypothetical protein TIFTF001_040431 [Ficus carica]
MLIRNNGGPQRQIVLAGVGHIQRRCRNPARVGAATAGIATFSTIADIVSPLRRTKKREPSTVGRTNLTGVGPPIVQIRQKFVSRGIVATPASVAIPSSLRRDSLPATVAIPCGANAFPAVIRGSKPTFRGSPTVSLTTFSSVDEFQRASGGGVVGGWSTPVGSGLALGIANGFARGRPRSRFPFLWPRILRWCQWILLRPNNDDPLRHLRQFLASFAGPVSWRKSWGGLFFLFLFVCNCIVIGWSRMHYNFDVHISSKPLN